jgi:CBS domain-containing protein
MTRCVRDVMTRAVVSVQGSARFKEIVRLLSEHRVSALPVVDAEGRVLGVVSEADLMLKEEGPPRDLSLPAGKRRRRERSRTKGRVAFDLMTAPAVTIGPEAPISQAARLLHRAHLKRVPVVDDQGHLVGIISRADLIRLFLRPDEEIRDEIIRDVFERILWMDPSSMRIDVSEGVARIEGQVERRSFLPLIARLVRGVDGVVDVEEHLTFKLDDTSISPERWEPWGVLPFGLRYP